MGFRCNRRQALAGGAALLLPREAPPERTVVLTFDDAVKSHRTFVGPLLREKRMGATFFVTQRWMQDTENFMNWTEIAELHRMGFEIGNHSWTHAGFNTPAAAGRLGEELRQVEEALRGVGVPRPTSFAWCGNAFGPEAVAVLSRSGYRLARRGMQPEVPYGQVRVGPAFDPGRHHPLLIPTAGDAYPDWNVEHFRKVLEGAVAGKIVVLQFHGVPDRAHPWVHTPPERFREYVDVLERGRYRVLSLREVGRYVDFETPPADPTLQVRYPA